MATLRGGDLTRSELLELLNQLTPPAEGKIRCWLEAADGWAFDDWPGSGGTVRWNRAGHDPCEEPLPQLLPRVTHGRLFSPAGELKWRVLPVLGQRCCRTVFLGDWPTPALEILPPRQELAHLRPEAAAYPLWGQSTRYTPGEWIDLRIPHRLKYPVEAQTPQHGRIIVDLKVEVWKDSRGEPQLIRFCDLSPHWEE